ncbi:MAG TPA: hypothetical protein VJY62_10085 [Bacteroidia bacterium]|nr:hypothetical protein [Bacteroidia bacterium]
MKERKLTSKTVIGWCFSLLILLSSVSVLPAQETRKGLSPGEKSTEITLRVKGLREKTSVDDLEKLLSSYPKKILSHVIDRENNSVTLLISDKISVIDLLQVMEMNSFPAAYLNEKNEYVALDPDDEDELGQPADIK